MPPDLSDAPRPLDYARPRRPHASKSGLIALVLVVTPAVWAPLVFHAFAVAFENATPSPVQAGALTLLAALPAMVGCGFLVESFRRARGVADNPYGTAAGAILAGAVLVAFLRLFA